MANKVPAINIMPEVEEEEDDDDNNLMSLMDALTDVEDLDDVQPKRTRPKLLIKLPRNDCEALTDVEDIEGSDIEDEPRLAKHSRPINLDNVLDDYGYIHESCDMDSRGVKAKLHSQKSLPVSNKRLCKIEEDLTDIEYFSGDDETPRSYIKDSVLPRCFETYDTVSTKDSIKYDTIVGASPSRSPIQTKQKQKGETMRLSASMPQMCDLTDVEMLESEYESDESFKPKSKKNKKRRGKKAPVSIDKGRTASDQDCKIYSTCNYLEPKPSTSRKCKKSQIEMDPVTDVEELNVSPKRNQKLFYRNASPKRFQVKQSTQLPTQGSSKKRQAFSKQIEPRHESSDSDSDENKYQSKKSIRTQNLFVSKINKKITSCPTDIEDFESSDDESYKHGNYLKLPEKYVSADLTDEEFLDAENYVDTIPEIILQASKRELIRIKEIANNAPTVLITPLTEDINIGLNFSSVESTDVESLSGDESLLAELPDIPTSSIELESGNVEEHESLVGGRSEQHLRPPSPQMQEILTDTEDLVVDGRSNLLMISNPHNHGGLTDTEDLYLSDQDSRRMKKSASPISFRDDLTDIEQFEASDDDRSDVNVTVNNRERCSTPLHLREIGGDTVVMREGHGPFGKHERKVMNKTVKKMKAYLSVDADSDDIVTSCDDESRSPTPVQIFKSVKNNKPKVMYLKGGNFSQNLVDMEDFPDAEDDEGRGLREGNKYVIARCVKSVKKYKVMLLAKVKSRKNSFAFLTMYYLNYGYEFPINAECKFLGRHRKLPESIAKLVSKFESLGDYQSHSYQNPMARFLRVKSNCGFMCGSIKEKCYNQLTGKL
nr:uncharacterized protein LOC111414892 [Onthophagus taurus]